MNPDQYFDGSDPADDSGIYEGCAFDTYRWCHRSYAPLQDRPGLTSTNIFGSAHPQSMNMSFCDGRVHQVSYDISPEVHAYQGNRSDGQAL